MGWAKVMLERKVHGGHKALVMCKEVQSTIQLTCSVLAVCSGVM